jgi:hypothetical protein
MVGKHENGGWNILCLFGLYGRELKVLFFLISKRYIAEKNEWEKRIFVVFVSAGLALPRAYGRKEANRKNTYKEEMNENGAKESEDKGEFEQSRGETTLPPPFFLLRFFFLCRWRKINVCTPGYNQAGKFDDILIILIKVLINPNQNQYHQTAKMRNCPGY